jgi:hypothetical protein
MLKGNDLIIKLNGTAIAAAKGCSLDVRTQAIPVSSPQDGNWQHYKGGKSSWVVRVNCLVMSVRGMVLRRGQTYTLRMEVRELSTDFVQGTALCTAVNTTGVRGNMAQGSFELTGSGALTDGQGRLLLATADNRELTAQGEELTVRG